MEYSVSFELKHDYVHIRVTGDNNPATVKRYLDDVVRICQEHGCLNVLIEERLSGPRLDTLEVFKIIQEKATDTARRLRKIAFIEADGGHEPGMVHLAEALAAKRGVRMQAFPSVAEAEAWMQVAGEDSGTRD